MSILVTGGFGLIGSALTRTLVENGVKVWALDKWTGSQRFSGIEDRVKMIEAELGNFAKILEAVRVSDPKVIFHLV